MKIIPLSEGSYTVDKTKEFIPFDAAQDLLATRAPGSLLVEIQPFLVITSADIILLDAGLGFKKDGEWTLVKQLRANGIGASEITKVFLSHLHKDHIGAIYDIDTNAPVFPNAKYYVQKTEWDFAMTRESASFRKEMLSWMPAHPQVNWLDGSGVIDHYIQYEISGGHSPHHQVCKIVDGGEIVFYGGDEAPQLQQMKHRFAAKYDADGKKAMQLRQQWWERGEKEKWTFLFYHDIKNPTWKFD
jgi:glyoxylase-like metal-dependent hydrolase (beta-lactamase superfamily II)